MPTTGEHRPDRPEKNNHAANFDRALSNALREWTPGEKADVTIRFEASISQNPGGIGTYRVILE